MTNDLGNALEKLFVSSNENVQLALKVWIDVPHLLALDMKTCVAILVVEADVLNKIVGAKPRTVIRSATCLPGLAKLSTIAPWNQLLVVSPMGEVRLNESLTKEEVAELRQIHSRYATRTWDFFTFTAIPGANESDNDQTPPSPTEVAGQISRKTGLQRRKLPNTPAKRMLHSCFVWRTPERITRNQWIVYKGPVTVVYDSSTETYAQMDSDGIIGMFEPLANLVARLDKEIDPSKYPKAHQVN